MKIEIEREDDGRWIAEIPELPGVMAYGDSRNEAISKAEALALRVLADRLEHGHVFHPGPSGIRAHCGVSERGSQRLIPERASALSHCPS
jgi:predicted RNase H-like HicB family nuclease